MNKRKNEIEVLIFSAAKCAISDHEKLELIRKFQRMEGSLDCYTSAYSRVCNQSTCLWRNDCREIEQHGAGYEQIA